MRHENGRDASMRGYRILGEQKFATDLVTFDHDHTDIWVGTKIGRPDRGGSRVFQ